MSVNDKIATKNSKDQVYDDDKKSNSLQSSSNQKKIPPIKAPVGLAAPPNIQNASSKVGSLDNAKHKPGGGDKKIFDERTRYEYTHLKRDSKGNLNKKTIKNSVGENHSSNHVSSSLLPKDKQSTSSKKPPTQIKKVKSKVGSLENISHKPGGGDKKVFDEKVNSPKKVLERLDSENSKDKTLGSHTSSHSLACSVKSLSQKEGLEKASSREEFGLVPFRSSKKIVKKIPPIKARVSNAFPANIEASKSKVGSLDNIKHVPKGGDKKIENVELNWKAESKVGSLDNYYHEPGGGTKKIFSEKLDFKNVDSKVGSTDNWNHTPGGGTNKVPTMKLDFREKAESKVGSLDNIDHTPGGGNVKIIDEKYYYSKKPKSKDKGD